MVIGAGSLHISIDYRGEFMLEIKTGCISQGLIRVAKLLAWYILYCICTHTPFIHSFVLITGIWALSNLGC